MNSKRFILIFVILLNLGSLKAQRIKSFSTETEEYLSQFEEFMKVNISESNNSLLDKWLAHFSDSSYSPEEKVQLIELQNELRKKKGRPDPHFFNLIDVLMILKENEISASNYNVWLEATQNVFENKKYSLPKTNKYLEFTRNFITQHILGQTSSALWVYDPVPYTFELAEPLMVQIDKTTFHCYAKKDSIEVYDISGKLDPLKDNFNATEALITWERGGFSRNETYAELKNFKINVRSFTFSADSTLYYNKQFFTEPIPGKIEHKVMRITNNVTYPKFFSYQTNFKITDLYPDITYEGGFSMEGSKLVGRGTTENPAHIYIFRNDTMLVNARSNYFGFQQEQVVSKNTSISILLESDSIFHPDLNFNFRVASRELTLLRNDNFTSQGPYYNSYHNVDMNFDQLSWNINTPIMHFTAQRGASIGNANFESINLFDQGRFDILFGMDFTHPLIKVRSFSRKIKSEEFTIEQYANYTKLPLTQVRRLMMDLSRYGYVFYDINAERVIIKQRLHDYIAANAGKIDYDVINFESSTRSPLENASFNTRTFDLIINGIPQVTVSNSQNVNIIPTGEKITLKRNRNFQFDGKIQAGLLTFYGSNFFFNYDTFKINLTFVDSINIKYLTGKVDNYGQPIIGQIKNSIRDITGVLLIDSASNKSGVKDFPSFPIFKSYENSYVYYNEKTIQNGVYTKDRFYFELEPFTIDSLDNFRKEGLQYNGTLYSSGIFPPIQEKLRLQKDESLGFLYKTPAEGLPNYGDKGIYKNNIHLSNNGLRGEGTLEYITSVTNSKDFIFLPDSMNTLAAGFLINKKTTTTEYPWVQSANNNIHWEPYNNQMDIKQTDTRFNMFNDSTYLSGAIKLNPEGLTGKGSMDLKNSVLKSDYFAYKAMDIFSDTTEFMLKSLHSDGFTVLADNMNTHIDYRAKKGYLESNDEFSLVTFPENQYVSYIDYFIWHMPDFELEMRQKDPINQSQLYANEDNIEPVGPRYLSVHPDQDSLNFISPQARYDYRNNLIKAQEVKFIQSADARIYPSKGEVTVAEDARMLALNESVVITNDSTEYHRIYNATININGRYDYTGKGDYDYVDELNKIQVIHFAQIEIDENIQTVARGQLLEADDFTLSPNYQYQGKVTLNAKDQFLNFEGAALIEHNCDKISPRWLKFEAQIDPLNIYLPVPEQMNDVNNQKIFAGPFIYYDSVHIYPSFITSRKNYSDQQIVTANGYLFYNQKKQEYIISSKNKISDFTLPDNYLSLHRENCDLYGEGTIELGEKTGLLDIDTYGSYSTNINDSIQKLDLIMYLDFYLKDELKNMFAWHVDSTFTLEPTNNEREIYTKSLLSKLGNEGLKRYRDEINLFGEAKEIPEAIRKTIVLNELHLQWDDETNSYRSVGDIGIASVFNTQINKKVKGYFEIQIKRSGDIMDMYLQIDENTYYYFGYTRGVLHTLSSNKNYNNIIKDLKAKERKYKIKGDRTPYIFILAADRKRAIAIRRWEEWLTKISP